MAKKKISIDHRVIANLIPRGSSVLDLGSGNGDLLVLLQRGRDCRVQGIEIDEECIYKSVARGLSVLHGDIDSGLADFPPQSFDYVVLNGSLQELKWPDKAMEDALRVGRSVIVGFPNFAYWKARSQIFLTGKTPVTPSLPWKWYETPNLHFLTILDFEEYCVLKKTDVLRRVFIRKGKAIRFMPNLLAQYAIYLMSRSGSR